MSFFDTHHLDVESLPLHLKSGTDYAVEENADKLLAATRKGVTALREKRDWLSRDQLQLVASKEVLNANGFSDEALMSGLFRRAYNPLAGHRPTKRLHADDA
jgi:hypothetical protein